MDGVLLFFDLMVVVLSFASVIMLVSIVLRTEKWLDKAMKSYLIVAIVILIASVIQLNKHYSLISLEKQNILFLLSRVVAMYFFCTASYMMLKIVNKEHK